ncbi:hypothetical protein GO755_29600 [Spirosoma sp. HMF4905]|uniref:Uncharacterized protein n=1 Tax=Spirosoma arboris TaxID=2682092 RepID=A0A7K1SKI0_9BACT|nr:hypothetical protein [Spirosoma arboris]MVM34223.1 hypothetical protein [Spirosoma arboris]
MAIPGVRQKVSEINQLGGGVVYQGTQRIPALSPIARYTPHRMEYGGVISNAANGVAPIDYGQMQRVLVNAIQSLPNPIVDVGNIRTKVNRQVRVENRADVKG